MSREIRVSPIMTVPRFILYLLRIPYFSLHFHATVLQVVGSATTTIFDHMNFCGAARDRTRDKPLAYFQLAYILRQVECRTCYPFGHRACLDKGIFDDGHIGS